MQFLPCSSLFGGAVRSGAVSHLYRDSRSATRLLHDSLFAEPILEPEGAVSLDHLAVDLDA